MKRIACWIAAMAVGTVAGASQASTLDACLAGRELPRVARVLGPEGRPIYARVATAGEGVPTAVVPIAEEGVDLAEVFERAARIGAATAAAWEIPGAALASRVCSPVRMSQAQIDEEERVIVAAGLNYAAHAEEAGGGDVFFFPKPVAPSAPYGVLATPEGVTLLDYEVELGFVLLEDVDLRALPSRRALLARAAFFVANDVSDREPIIRHKALRGPGTGFVEGKGQPGFLPIGPWMVRGTELFEALSTCGAEGLALRLEIDEGDGFRVRQEASSERMILDPLALLARLASEVERHGLRTPMPSYRDGAPRYDRLAVDADAPRLPAGSIVLTGTPEGVALQAPNPLGVTLRGLLRGRSPLEQFLIEERERAASDEPHGYLAPGDRMRASIDGLGAQIVRVAGPGARSEGDPCLRGRAVAR